jgi:hypothetical protein
MLDGASILGVYTKYGTSFTTRNNSAWSNTAELDPIWFGSSA